MTGTVDQRRRQLHAPIAAPFTPEQEARVRELAAAVIAEQQRELCAALDEIDRRMGVPTRFRRITADES